MLGGFLLQFTMGAFYSFGNMSTYMTSYMRQHGSPHISYDGKDNLVQPCTIICTISDFIVVQSTWGMTQGIVMPFSGFIINAIGQRVRNVFSQLNPSNPNQC